MDTALSVIWSMFWGAENCVEKISQKSLKFWKYQLSSQNLPLSNFFSCFWPKVLITIHTDMLVPQTCEYSSYKAQVWGVFTNLVLISGPPCIM